MVADNRHNTLTESEIMKPYEIKEVEVEKETLGDRELVIKQISYSANNGQGKTICNYSVSFGGREMVIRASENEAREFFFAFIRGYNEAPKIPKTNG